MKPHILSTSGLAALSGAAALGHELLWTRRLVDLLGATGEATARVFGCFFLGLSIGGLAAAYLLPRVKRAWSALGYSELAIAVLALPALFLHAWTDWIWPALGPESLESWLGTLIKTFLSGAVVLLPAIPMGMTLPFFVAAAAHRHGVSSRGGVWIYGVNTLGGVVGLLTTSTLLLERLGVAGCLMTAVGVNVFVGFVALAISRKSGSTSSRSRLASRRSREVKNKQEVAVGAAQLDRRSSVVLAFFSGLATLMLELLAIRMVSLVVPSSFQATVAVLASVILVLGIAAISTPVLLRALPSPRRGLLIAFLGASVLTCLAPHVLYRQTSQLVDVSHLAAMAGGHIANTTEFVTAVCGIAFLTVGPALLVSGTVLPTIFVLAPGGEKGIADGRRFGWLLAANGLGGMLGAELTNLVILPTCGIYRGFAAAGWLYALAVVCLLKPWQRPTAVRWLTSWAVVAIPLVWGQTFLNRIPYLSPRTTEPYDIQATQFGRDGVLLVVETPSGGQGILLNNQYLLGSSGGKRDERREVLLPMLLHPKPERVCCVGLATGISAGAALDYPGGRQVTAVEISSQVVDAARDYFGEHNNHLFEDDGVKIVIEDGRTYVAAARERFDVIVGDLYRPYGAGEGRLFSVEHFRAARWALRDGGLFCQWLPMYQLTESQFRIIVATFLDAFPGAELVRANHNPDYPMLGLVGWKGAPPALDHLPTICKALQQSDNADDEELLSPENILALRLGALDRRQFQQEPRNTLNNALIEIVAGRRKITRNLRKSASDVQRQEPYLVGDDWNEFDNRLVAYLKSQSVLSSPRDRKERAANPVKVN